MKKVATLLTIAAVALIAVSCGKVEKILPKKDGEWQVTYQKVVTTDDTGAVLSTQESSNVDSLAIIHFEKDGSGHSINPDGSEDAFTWAVNDDNDVITMTMTDSTGTTSMDWDIIESSSKEMQLKNVMTITVFGTWTITTDMTMERAE